MNKYQLVSDIKPEEPSKDNEIRINKNGTISKYISYAIKLIQQENKTFVIRAMGLTIQKAITVAEILKRRIAGLHQLTELGSVEVIDIFEPLEEGLDRVEVTRKIPAINITLSTQPLNSYHPGYQAPIPPDVFAQVSAQRPNRGSRRGPRPFRNNSKKEERTESKENGAIEKGRGKDNRPRQREAPAGRRPNRAPYTKNTRRPGSYFRNNNNRQRRNSNRSKPSNTSSAVAPM